MSETKTMSAVPVLADPRPGKQPRRGEARESNPCADNAPKGKVSDSRSGRQLYFCEECGCQHDPLYYSPFTTMGICPNCGCPNHCDN